MWEWGDKKTRATDHRRMKLVWWPRVFYIVISSKLNPSSLPHLRNPSLSPRQMKDGFSRRWQVPSSNT